MKVRRYLYPLLLLGISVYFGFRMAERSGGKVPVPLASATNLVILGISCLGGYVIFLFTILVHELGHIIGGAAVGTNFKSLNVHRLGLSRSDGRWHCYWIPKPLAGGLAVMEPDPNRDVISSYRVFTLGGPLASLALAAVSWWIFGRVEIEGRKSIPEVMLWGGALMLLMMSAMVAVTTLFPYVSKGFATDAKLLIMLSRRSADQDRFVLLNFMGRQAHAGVRAREWTEKLVRDGIAIEDSSMSELRARLMAYYHDLDSGRIEEAEQHLRRAKEVSDSLKKQAGFLAEAVDFETAFLRAWHQRTEEGVEDLLAAHPEPSVFTKGSWHRARAALAMLRGNQTAADRELGEATRALQEAGRLYGVRGTTEEAWLEEMRQELASAAIRDSAVMT